MSRPGLSVIASLLLVLHAWGAAVLPALHAAGAAGAPPVVAMDDGADRDVAGHDESTCLICQRLSLDSLRPDVAIGRQSAEPALPSIPQSRTTPCRTEPTWLPSAPRAPPAA